MKILVTGSSGYLGRLLVRDLVRSGISVAGIDIRADPRQEPDNHFVFYNTCVTDKPALRDIFLKERPDVVIHFACTFNRVRSRKREAEIDLGGSSNIIELSNEITTVRKIIFSSSAAIYGGHKRPSMWLDENDPLKPGKYRYGLNKKLIEHSLFNSERRDDLHVISLRICTVVGPTYFKPGSVVSLLIRWPWFPRSLRHNKVQFMHEEDFTALLSHVIADDGIEGSYNFSTDSYSVVSEIAPGKRYVSFPVAGLKPVLWLLWNLRLLNLQPAGLTYALHPVLLNPARLVSRFGYRFRYSSSEAFLDTLQHNSLPSGSRY